MYILQTVIKIHMKQSMTFTKQPLMYIVFANHHMQNRQFCVHKNKLTFAKYELQAASNRAFTLLYN